MNEKLPVDSEEGTVYGMPGRDDIRLPTSKPLEELRHDDETPADSGPVEQPEDPATKPLDPEYRPGEQSGEWPAPQESFDKQEAKSYPAYQPRKPGEVGTFSLEEIKREKVRHAAEQEAKEAAKNLAEETPPPLPKRLPPPPKKPWYKFW